MPQAGADQVLNNLESPFKKKNIATHTHTHTHIYTFDPVDSGLPVTSKSQRVLLMVLDNAAKGGGAPGTWLVGTGLRAPQDAPWAHQNPLPVPSEVVCVLHPYMGPFCWTP